jgi:uncharacterized membrane-anchored protein YjiN (DUF445 family)
LLTERRTDWLLDRVLIELQEVSRDAQHPWRVRVDDLLRSLAADLEANPVTAARVDLVVRRLFDDERFQEPVRRFVEEATESLRASLADDETGLAVRVARVIRDIGGRLADDTELQTSVEGWLRRAVIHAVREYGDEVTELIRRTVEVAVGRDLQFIRINGTVVGALAGLVIHAVTVAA